MKNFGEYATFFYNFSFNLLTNKWFDEITKSTPKVYPVLAFMGRFRKFSESTYELAKVMVKWGITLFF